MASNMTPEEIKKRDRKLALSVFGKTMLALVFGIMCYLGLGMLSAIGQELSGYNYYSEPVENAGIGAIYDTSFLRYDFYAVDGETYTLDKSYVYSYDTHSFEYSEELTAQTRETRPTIDVDALSEELPEGVQMQTVYQNNTVLETVIEVISQILLLVLLVMLVYEVTWRYGDHDRNKVQFGRMPEDKGRGLKAGLIGSIPGAVVVLLLFFSKLTGLLPHYIVFYRIYMMSFGPINNALTGGVMWMQNVSWWMLPVSVLCWAVVPLTAAIGYWLGYKGVSVGERIVYKKK